MKTLLLLILSILAIQVKGQTVITFAGGNGVGNAPYQLSNPAAVCGDDSGNIYVSDPINHRVQKFPPGSNSNTFGITVAGGSTYTSIIPQGLYVDKKGNVYITTSNRIMLFNAGSDSTTTGTVLVQGNQLKTAGALFVDNNGNIYVTDFQNNLIRKFAAGSTISNTGTIAAGGNGMGNAPNQLNRPAGIFVDGKGYLYVADFGNGRVQKFPPNSTGKSNGVTIAGGDAAKLNSPIAIFVDSIANTYVTDYSMGQVLKFPPNSTPKTNGVVVAGSAATGSDDDQLDMPGGLYVDPEGCIYVADNNNNRIQKWWQGPPVIHPIPLVEKKITIDPNPNGGAFTLQSADDVKHTFIVYDLTGRIIAQQPITTDNQPVDLDEIEAGIYILKIAGSTDKPVPLLVHY